MLRSRRLWLAFMALFEGAGLIFMFFERKRSMAFYGLLI